MIQSGIHDETVARTDKSGARRAAKPRSRAVAKVSASPTANSELREILSLAKAKGLLSGTRSKTVRGRMPVELVAEAKLRSGITSDSKLLEAALANLALSDNYGKWLIANRGTINPDLDLEF